MNPTVYREGLHPDAVVVRVSELKQPELSILFQMKSKAFGLGHLENESVSGNLDSGGGLDESILFVDNGGSPIGEVSHDVRSPCHQHGGVSVRRFRFITNESCHGLKSLESIESRGKPFVQRRLVQCSSDVQLDGFV